MKVFHLVILCSSACIIALLTSCGSSGSGSVSENTVVRGYNPGVGPFNSQGDYIESWADDKSKGRWWRSGNYVAGSSNAVSKKKSKPKYTAKPKAVAAAKPLPKPAAAAYSPPLPAPAATKSKPKVTTYKKPTYTAPAPKPVVKKVSKPKVVKVVPKRKAPIRYIARRTDTLWSISQKYKVSVDAIKAANGLKNNSIYGGRVLLIPQY